MPLQLIYIYTVCMTIICAFRFSHIQACSSVTVHWNRKLHWVEASSEELELSWLEVLHEWRGGGQHWPTGIQPLRASVPALRPRANSFLICHAPTHTLTIFTPALSIHSTSLSSSSCCTSTTSDFGGWWWWWWCFSLGIHRGHSL